MTPAHTPRPAPALAALLLLTACAPRAAVQPETTIAVATGISGAIAFRIERGPLDEPFAPAPSLLLHEAVRRAVTTDPALQAALARVRIALADADQARLLPNPVLDIALRWGPGKPQIEASLTEDLLRVLTLRRRASAADNRLRQAAAEAVTVALDVLTEVQERYAAVQALDALMPTLEQRAGLLDRLVLVAESRLRAGEGARTDLTTFQAQRAELEIELAQARIESRGQRLRLARLIGEPSGAAEWTLEPWSEDSPGDEPEARCIDTALRHRPEVQAAAWQLAALGDDVALARLLPFDGASAGVDAQRDDEWFAGPSVTMPIPVFDTGQAQRARVTAARIEARHNLTFAQRKVVEEVRTAYATLAGSRANLARIRRQLLPLQQQRRDRAETAFRGGQTDAAALFLAEQDLRAAQARAIEVERQAAVALIRLQRAVGGPGVAAELSSSRPLGGPTPDSTIRPPKEAHP